VAPQIEVVRFQRRHLARVLQIEKASFPSEAYNRRMFLDLRRDCGDLFLVARRAGRLAGYMVTCTESGEAEIISIAVTPEARGAGVGTALMRQTLARLDEAGVKRAWLMVRTTGAETIRFYRGFGFRAAGRVEGYYQDGGAALRMRRGKLG
jgi:ribosomal-protein-alanine acetyltransferase